MSARSPGWVVCCAVAAAVASTGCRLGPPICGDLQPIEGATFSGPAPRVDAGDAALRADAQSGLDQESGIEPEQAQALLDWAIWVFRNWREALGPDDVSGWCGPARDLVYHALRHQGVGASDLLPHATERAFETRYVHQFLVARMADGRSNLVDPTYRQFFGHRTSAKHPGEDGWADESEDPEAYDEELYELIPDRVGSRVRRDECAANVADLILRDGYIELSKDVIDRYADGFTGGAGNPYDVDTVADKTNGVRGRSELLERLAEKVVEDDLAPRDADAQAVVEEVLGD